VIPKGYRLWHRVHDWRTADWWQIADQWFRTIPQRLVLAPTRQGAAIRYALAALFGIVLATGVLIAGTFPKDMMFMSIGMMLAPFMAMMVGDLRRVMLIAIPLEMTFQVDGYFNYQSIYARIGALGGFNVSLTTLFLIMLYTLWFTEILARRGKLAHVMPHISMPHFLYIGVVFLSVTVAYNTTLASFEINLLLQAFLVHIYISSTVRTKEELFLILKMLLLALWIQGMFMILVRGLGRSLSLGPVEFFIDAANQRVGGSVGGPNGASNYVVTFAAMSLCVFLTRHEKIYKALAMAAFFSGVAGMFLTQSRGGMIAFTLSFILICAFGIPRGWVPRQLPKIAVGVAIVGGLILGPILFARFLEDDGGSAESRLPLAQMAWEIIGDHPVLGVGSNNFAYVMPNYITPEFAAEWLYTVHNKYLLVWAETGTLGLITFLLIPFSIIYQGWLCWRAKDMDAFPGLIAIGFAASTVGLIFHMQFDIFNSRPQVMTLWLTSALTTAICRMRNTDPNPIQKPLTE
jgi:O-antigen ligase